MKRAEVHNLVKRLGGPSVVGRACGLTHSAVCKWRQVPVEHIQTVVRLALERQVTRSDGTNYGPSVLRPDLADLFESVANAV